MIKDIIIHQQIDFCLLYLTSKQGALKYTFLFVPDKHIIDMYNIYDRINNSRMEVLYKITGTKEIQRKDKNGIWYIDQYIFKDKK